MNLGQLLIMVKFGMCEYSGLHRQARIWHSLSRGLARFLAASFAFCWLSGVALADDQDDFQSRLRGLHTAATSLTLMVVKKGLQFFMALDEEGLPGAACSYHVEADKGVSFKEMLELLELSTYPDESAKSALQTPFDTRIGLIFKNGAEVVGKFYFEDSVSGRTIRGHSAWKGRTSRIWLGAQASFPDRLRAFAGRPDVVLTGNRPGRCGPS